ncbi:hypothetical protein [Streptomyces sp. V1I1]|uniref:hypothetical protein n=1 Tax=Streptomyces sp. V1I1 TaxID=3042272 RepID=UPI002784E0DE|nr:hypothetical protein [Streptomyces sp. V1I1]MDQ0946019.1 hypothetical protein [Streptomyces sp. V1I1]
MEEVVLRLKELLFPSVADVTVLSVDVTVMLNCLRAVLAPPPPSIALFDIEP